jgi:hypothetical protein
MIVPSRAIVLSQFIQFIEEQCRLVEEQCRDATQARAGYALEAALGRVEGSRVQGLASNVRVNQFLNASIGQEARKLFEVIQKEGSQSDCAWIYSRRL